MVLLFVLCFVWPSSILDVGAEPTNAAAVVNSPGAFIVLCGVGHSVPSLEKLISGRANINALPYTLPYFRRV